MNIKNKDFVEIEYTGRTKEDNFIFDTTEEKVAKENNLFDKKKEYGPIIIVVGERHIVKGLDEFINNKDLGEYKIDLSPEDAFGKKNAKLIKMVPIKEFTKHKIRPQPGLQLEIDGTIGTVKTVSGGRTVVDFNHPLAGKEVSYDFKILRVIDDTIEKIKSFLKLALGLKNPKVSIENNTAKIELPKKLPIQISKPLGERLTELCGINKVEFVSTGEQ